MRYSTGSLLIGFTLVSLLLVVGRWGWNRHPEVCQSLATGIAILGGGLTLNHFRRAHELPGRLPVVLLVTCVVVASVVAVYYSASLWGLLAGGLLGIVLYQTGPPAAAWALSKSGVESD